MLLLDELAGTTKISTLVKVSDLFQSVVFNTQFTTCNIETPLHSRFLWCKITRTYPVFN